MLRYATLVFLLSTIPALAGDGNRLAYLDDPVNPYYVHKDFPKLTTPMWVGEEGVECVVILGIDDMRGHEKWEAYLRPILERLKKIDGRAPVSIMTCTVDPKELHLQTWLKEGVSLECHTVDHPCPLLQKGDFNKAKDTYDRCVDLLHEVPNNKPVAFRTPCCDSLNTNSPRMYAEIFNKTTPKRNFLSIDTSVFNVFTSADTALPRELVLEGNQERFKKYLPRDRSFVNTIENYPYPYVIGKLCWEFPCVTPSDWQAQHLHKPNNPVTVHDWQAALDCTVIKQGVYCLVFHPHGWITNEQIIELIDYAVSKHGKKVKFLTFKEAEERLNRNVLGGQTLRDADGRDNGVRLLDVNNDGFMDVAIANDNIRQTRVWTPKTYSWMQTTFPMHLVWSVGIIEGDKVQREMGAHFGIFQSNGFASLVAVPNVWEWGAWHFDGARWNKDENLLHGLKVPEAPHDAWGSSWDRGVRLQDLNQDGRCEVVVASSVQLALYAWDVDKKTWSKGILGTPPQVVFMDDDTRDAGLRFIDLDGRGKLDIVFSNEERYGVYLFESMEKGWSKCVASGGRKPPEKADPVAAKNSGDLRPPLAGVELLPITIKGQNNGFFVHSRHFWWQNENTSHLKDHMHRVSFDDLLKDVQPGPKQPEDSRKCIQTRPGFTVELVAAEPLVMDPIAFAWGPDGKFWVVEMGSYPTGIPSPPAPLPQGARGESKAGGRIKFLEDTNNDGKYDKATLFLDGLAFPTGVMPWRKGVLVTCAPDIFYAEDTDGDGKADKREVLYTGFTRGNPQHLVNSLVWGLDNWVYCANGDSGGRIKSLHPPLWGRAGVGGAGATPLPPRPSPIKGEGEVDIRGRDFRIRPDTGEIETTTGQTQFGRSRDDWGNWFGGNNANPLWHFVLDDHYLRRNPHFAPPNPRVDVPVTPGHAPVYPISRTLTRFNDFHTANRFTSACSPIVYRDELFGPDFVNNVFISEPVHNLIHREVMKPKGVTFTSQRAPDEQQSEFLASSDNWFRPTMIQTGPDGALWIADMYRLVIEHPEWIPKDWQAKLDLRAGHDMGRIYRVYPTGKKPRAIPRLDKLDPAGLVAALDSPNGWQRDMAQMMLVRQGTSPEPDAPARAKQVVPLLEKMARNHKRPLTRLHALCALDGIEALNPLDLGEILGTDPHSGVIRHAVRLAEKRFNDSNPLWNALVLRMANDPMGKDLNRMNPQVRMQFYYALGESTHKPIFGGLGHGSQLMLSAADPYLSAALMTSITKENFARVAHDALLQLGSHIVIQDTDPHPRVMHELFRMALALNDHRSATRILGFLPRYIDSNDTWMYAICADCLDIMDQRNMTLAGLREATERQDALEGKDPFLDTKMVFQEIGELLGTARKLIGDVNMPRSARLSVIRLLGRGLDRQAEDLKTLASLLTPHNADDIQSAAVHQLGRLRNPKIPELLLNNWRSHGPRLRSHVLDVLLRRDEWTKAILDAMEKKSIAVMDIDAVHQQRLVEHKNTELRTRAGKLFAGSINADRQKVIEQYREALTFTGESKRGQAVFAKACAACHKLAGVGNDVGPDLAALSDKSNEYMLIHLLDPNRAVEARYVNYTATTKNGLTHTGVLTNETSTSITLIDVEGESQTILRNDLDGLASSGKSAMPEGLEKDLKPQDFADLFAYLRSVSMMTQRKVFDGNKPEVVVPDSAGILRLLASNAEIYGKTLVLENKYGNLGYWSSEDDRAVWTVEAPKAGKYAVLLEWACPDDAAGNGYILTIDDRKLTGTVASTGSWDKYKQEKVGEIMVTAGQQRAVFRSLGKIKGAMIDLKFIKLVPME